MIDCVWGLDDDPRSNVQHIAEHGFTKADVQHAVDNAVYFDVSQSSGNALLDGPAEDGSLIRVVYEPIDEDTIYPITAFLLGE